MPKDSPCLACSEVEEPIKCTKKNCIRWQKWFLAKWKEINNYYEEYKKELENG